MTKILMCRPDHFRVDYVINPWMKPGSVDGEKAMTQWVNLRHTYEKLGVQVEVIAQREDLPDMVFATDQGIVQGKKVLLSNFCHSERQGETQVYAQWFSSHGYEIARFEHAACEGGEVLQAGNSFFIGTGFRAQKACLPQLRSWLEKPVHTLELIDERFYHLDTCFFPLNSSTVFFYPPAFSQPSVDSIRSLFTTVFEFTKEQVLAFAANSIVVGKSVIGQPITSFQRAIEHLGYQYVAIDVSEFIKSGGGIHCLTLVLA